jgi:gamma-glutamylcysteine synthetase
VRHGDDLVPMPERLTFGAWIRDGHALGRPTADDLDYHLTTLFPPVRPRGFLELRFLDAVPDPWWRVAVAVTTALVQDRSAGEAAAAACAPVADRWYDSARCGLADPQLYAAALACLTAGRDALGRLAVPVSARTIDLCARFADCYVARRRTPADDLLDAWRRGRPPVALAPEGDLWT